MQTQTICIRPGGRLEFIYSDALAPLLTLGTAQITRASHVEPDPANPTQWLADLSPVDGPTLGPFPLRQAALDAEVAWLTANRL